MMLTRLLLAVPLLLPAGACTKKEGDAPTKAAEAEPGAPGAVAADQADPSAVETIAIAPRAAPRVTVESPGDEPRQEMRLHPTVGLRESVNMALAMEMRMQVGDQAMPAVPIPVTKTHLVVEVQEVGDDGFSMRHSIDSAVVEAKPETPQVVVDKMKETTEPLTKYRAVMRMDDRGAVLGGEVIMPRGLPPPIQQTMSQMTENLGQLAVPMPEEAVGPGARWIAVFDVEQNGMKLRQKASYVMTARDGDKASLELSITQELLDPKIKVPGMPGAAARVSRFAGSGKGTVEIDLGHVMPTALHMIVDFSMAMEVSAMGEDQSIEMDMAMDMTMERIAEG